MEVQRSVNLLSFFIAQIPGVMVMYRMLYVVFATESYLDAQAYS